MKADANTTLDAKVNKAIREVATTPSEQHVIPAEIVRELYEHADRMRVEFFGEQVPEIVLSFEKTNKKTLGHYHIKRTGLGVRWVINLNPIHLSRPLYRTLSTLLHEMAHAWQHAYGTPSKPPHHNAEFCEKCEAFGIPTNTRGYDLGVRDPSPFADYCRKHGVPVMVEKDGKKIEPPPLLPAPPAKPGGSKLKKWVCACPVNVRVAIAEFDATCNRCGATFHQV